MSEFDIVDKEDIAGRNIKNEQNKQKNEPSNGQGIFELFGQDDTKGKSIVDILESNDWTKFSNEELIHLIPLTKDGYSQVKIPVEHNNAIFKNFLDTIKINESLLNGMQAEALLQQFGRKVLYDHCKRSTLINTLLVCRNTSVDFHTVNQCPGIDVNFLDSINYARNKKDLLIRTVPKEYAMNINISDLLRVETNKLVLVDYLFAFDYIFHNDSRYKEKRTASSFDLYYKSSVTELLKRINNMDNIIWLINKFPSMLANTIAWNKEEQCECNKIIKRFEAFSSDDMPNIKTMKNTLHDAALLIQENIKNRGLIVDAYTITILQLYDNRHNTSIFKGLV